VCCVAGRERPRCCRTTDQGDELSPSHELPSLAHHWTMRVPVHRGEIFPLMSVHGQTLPFRAHLQEVCFTSIIRH
jgi:hypothetical protein